MAKKQTEPEIIEQNTEPKNQIRLTTKVIIHALEENYFNLQKTCDALNVDLSYMIKKMKSREIMNELGSRMQNYNTLVFFAAMAKAMERDNTAMKFAFEITEVPEGQSDTGESKFVVELPDLETMEDGEIKFVKRKA